MTQLLQIWAGCSIPRHTHGGAKLTLVLADGFSTRSTLFLAGDVAIPDGAITHRPVADPTEDWLFLVLRDAPLRFIGAGRFSLSLLFRN